MGSYNLKIETSLKIVCHSWCFFCWIFVANHSHYCYTHMYFMSRDSDQGQWSVIFTIHTCSNIRLAPFHTCHGIAGIDEARDSPTEGGNATFTDANHHKTQQKKRAEFTKFRSNFQTSQNPDQIWLKIMLLHCRFLTSNVSRNIL